MTDILDRLRLSVTKGHEPSDLDAIDAITEIERLRAEFVAIVEYCERDGISAVERLRAVRNTAEQATRHLEQGARE